MEIEHIHVEEAPAVAERGFDDWNPWNLPRPAPVRTPTLDERPEREVGFGEGFARIASTPAA